MAIRRFVSQAFVVVCALLLPALAAAQALVVAASSASTPPSAAPKTYGTTATSYADTGEWEFSPINSATHYDDVGANSANALRFATSGNNAFLAPLHLPSGAAVQSVELDACDSNAGDSHVIGVAVHCDHITGLCAPIGGQITSTSAVINPCKSYVEDVSGLGYVVDNTGDRLLLEVVTQGGDGTTSFAGMRVGYVLQVSPAPGAADFGDVPTSHPFFQYIEALSKSGITGGCGSGNYCPDSFITRGQMAVFLAKALGLQWP
jgi:hypothetical protein